MTTEEVSDNKTIAEFMGWIKMEIDWRNSMEDLKRAEIYGINCFFKNGKFTHENGTEFKYHTSFDSIIPVAKKIYDLCEDNPRVFLHLVMYCPNIYHNNILSVKIENIFKECAEFIRWYKTIKN